MSEDDALQDEPNARPIGELAAGMQYAIGLSMASDVHRERIGAVAKSQAASESVLVDTAKQLRCLSRNLRKLSAKLGDLATKA